MVTSDVSPVVRRPRARPVDAEVESLIQVWESERPDIPMGSLRVSLPLRRALQHAEARRAKVLAKHGVSASTLDLLVALRRAGKPYVSTPSELARLLVLSSGGVSQRLERLEREGLVERRVSAADRRVVDVHLTEAGLAILDRLIDEYMDHEEQMLSGLSTREAAQLGRLLIRLDASIAASAK
jgi:DNA-binding MarR family transcriptional regulator